MEKRKWRSVSEVDGSGSVVVGADGEDKKVKFSKSRKSKSEVRKLKKNWREKLDTPSIHFHSPANTLQNNYGREGKKKTRPAENVSFLPFA